ESVTYTTTCNTGYDLTGGAGTYNPTCTASTCYQITLNKAGGSSGTSTLWWKNHTWYKASGCSASNAITTIPSAPTYTNYTFRGYFLGQHGAVTGDAPAPSDMLFNKNRAVAGIGSTHTFTGNATIYASWARNCATVSNGTCSLVVGTDGSVDYTTTCNSGYTLTSGGNTYNPTCTAQAPCRNITLNPGGGTAGAITAISTRGTGEYYNGTGCDSKKFIRTDMLPTKPGYTFRGFAVPSSNQDVNSDAAALSQQVISPTADFTIFASSYSPSSNTTIYAKWAQNCNNPISNGSCSLTVDLDGAVDYETTCNTGYTMTSGNNTYNPVCQVASTCYPVTFNDHGGTSANNNKPKYVKYPETVAGTFYEDSECTLTSDSVDVPTRSGYTFRGYFKTDVTPSSPHYGVTSDSLSAPSGQVFNKLGTQSDFSYVLPSDAAPTFYASWAKNCTSPVSNGTCSLSVTNAGAVDYTTTCNSGYTMTSGNNTYNPVCTLNVTFNVAYNAGGGSGTAPSSPTSCTYGGTCNAPSNPYTKPGYKFNYWTCTASSGSCAQSNYGQGASIANATSVNGATITLTATWDPIEFRVLYSAGTGGSGSAPTSPTECTYGQTCNAPANTYTAPSGKIFTGWACTSENNGSCGTIQPGASLSTITTVAGDSITLTAQWASCSCTNGTGASSCSGTAVNGTTCSYTWSC
ncbi:MAG: InlB B-repeat-containing protein, partial [Alphaproteobacteria bacterium]|nr:InlB B-repeat-containing protein [Alphaproteobacteria bacterium]